MNSFFKYFDYECNCSRTHFFKNLHYARYIIKLLFHVLISTKFSKENLIISSRMWNSRRKWHRLKWRVFAKTRYNIYELIINSFMWKTNQASSWNLSWATTSRDRYISCSSVGSRGSRKFSKKASTSIITHLRSYVRL